MDIDKILVMDAGQVMVSTCFGLGTVKKTIEKKNVQNMF